MGRVINNVGVSVRYLVIRDAILGYPVADDLLFKNFYMKFRSEK